MQYNDDIKLHMPTIESYAKDSRVVLELGPAKGNGSTHAIAEGMASNTFRGKMCVSVDIRDYMEEKPQFKWWNLILGDTRDQETVEKVKTMIDEGCADLIFIDTHHTYDQMKTELALWSIFAGKKTRWLFHDTWMMGEYNPMTDAIKEFAINNNLIYEDLSKESHGLGTMYDKN